MASGRQLRVTSAEEELSGCLIQLSFSTHVLREKPVPWQLGQPVSSQWGEPHTRCPGWWPQGGLGERQGAPGVLPQWHTQPRLWGHAAGGEGVVLGLEFELAVAAGQRFVRLALCLGHCHDGLSGILRGRAGLGL